MNKLALGTVQFGLHYGINNKKGKVLPDEVAEILQFASQSQIDTVDTASAYGDSEKVLGFCNKNANLNLKVIGKQTGLDYQSIEMSVKKSMDNLGVSKMYGLMVHHFSDFQDNPQILNVYRKIKQAGMVDRIGFSLYHPKELEYLINSKIQFDIIQVPFNIFDQRFCPYFSELKKRDIEIHVRSVFLQGLVFKDLERLEPFFEPLRSRLLKLKEISLLSGLNIATLCLCFALLNDKIDKVVVGVDSLQNLKDNVDSAAFCPKVINLISELNELSFENETILNPSLWKL